jgi:DNA-binding beta-propeller fold protein YncE
VRRFRFHSDGALEDTGQSFPAGLGPTNITFSPCGNFAFVSSRVENRLLVLSTRDPENILLLGGAACTPRPQSMAVTRDGRHVFLLTAETVDVYSFNPVAGSLTLTRSFEHGHSIRNLTGTDQIALDACDERVFVVTLTQVAVFTTYGLPLGNVVGAEGPGGIAICSCNWDHRV